MVCEPCSEHMQAAGKDRLANTRLLSLQAPASNSDGDVCMLCAHHLTPTQQLRQRPCSRHTSQHNGAVWLRWVMRCVANVVAHCYIVQAGALSKAPNMHSPVVVAASSTVGSPCSPHAVALHAAASPPCTTPCYVCCCRCIAAPTSHAAASHLGRVMLLLVMTLHQAECLVLLCCVAVVGWCRRCNEVGGVSQRLRCSHNVPCLPGSQEADDAGQQSLNDD